MKLTFIGLTLVFLSAACVLCDHPPVTESEKEFEKEFLKDYKDKAEEKEAASQLKLEEAQINKENKLYDEGKANFYEKLNWESDVPMEEFERTREGAISETPERGLGSLEDPEDEWHTDEDLIRLYERQEVAPPEWNSVTKNLVTKVKNQGQCGSCSAFASTSMHETCMLMAGAKMEGLDLSEQYLIDCGYNPNDYRDGCKGASPGKYTKYYSDSMEGVSPHEYDYSYLNTNPKLVCPNDVKPRNFGTKVSKSLIDNYCTEEKLKTLITQYGAVVTNIHASEVSFVNYAGGIFDKCTNNSIDHAVVAVGYGTENGIDYWLMKNSWKDTWGMNGFFKLKRGVGMCGVGSYCSTAECEKTSGALSNIPSVPATSECKLEGYNKSGVDYSLEIKGKEVIFNCKNGYCKRTEGGFDSVNACVAICGEMSCP